MRILIPAFPNDEHAHFVSLTLERAGHEARLWYTADFPVFQTNSFELCMDHSVFRIEDDGERGEQYDCVWFRRPARPSLSPALHPDDRQNSYKENRGFYESMWRVVSPGSKWVNPHDAARSANCKMLQLKVAMETGLHVAPTLISNHPDRIRSFIASASRDGVVYKSLYPLAWQEEDGIRLNYTRRITSEDLPSDSTLQNTPGIYQYRIKKSYEVRVTYMGGYLLAVKLDSQSHPDGLQDWRAAPVRELGVQIHVLPDKLKEHCQRFMKRMGLVFGCLDFIVTPEEDYYFLEVNEQGQFLWIEDANPDIPMLDIFSKFIVSEQESFIYTPDRHQCLLNDFREAVLIKKQKAIQNHLSPDCRLAGVV